jgi:hypothetical protein
MSFSTPPSSLQHSSSGNTVAASSLFEHLDTATTDCLQTFQDGVAAAQRELCKEQDRLVQLEASLRVVRDRNVAMVRDKSDTERRVEALTTECARVRTLNTQLTDNICKDEQHVCTVRGPRTVANASVKEHEGHAVQLRMQYIKDSQAFVATALHALNPSKRPKMLQAQLTALQRGTTEVRGRIAALRAASACRPSGAFASPSELALAAVKDDAAGDEKHDLMLQLAALHEADANARAEHHQAQRALMADRDSLRDRVRLLTQQFEAIEVQSLEVQTSYNALVNEVCGSACRRCGGPLWTIGGDSGHE